MAVVKPDYDFRGHYVPPGAICGCCGRRIEDDETVWSWLHYTTDRDVDVYWIAHIDCLRPMTRGLIADLAEIMRIKQE